MSYIFFFKHQTFILADSDSDLADISILITNLLGPGNQATENTGSWVACK